MTIMTRRWIIAISLILSCVVAWTSAFPASPLLQRVTEDDEDELDSDEIELQKIREVINQRLGVSSASEDTTPQSNFNLQPQNPDPELQAIEATRLIWKYLSNSGTGRPLQIPTKTGNRTFIIQIVPSNAKGQQGGAEVANALGVGLRGEPDKAPPPPPPPTKTITTTTTTTTQAPTTTTSTEPTPPPKPPLPDDSPTTSAQVPAHPFEISTASSQPVLSEQEGLNNIEGAILEALSIAQQVGGSPEVIPTEPGPGQVQVVKVVQVPGTAEQAEVVQNLQVQGQGSPTDSQQYQVPQVVFINPYVPTEATTQYIPAAHAIKAVSTLIGSLAEGNLGGVVQSSINLAGTDVVQNSAKLAAAGILHSGVSWVNCQVFRNCKRPNYID